MKQSKILLVAVMMMFVVGCSFTSKATNFNGMTTCDGAKPTHVSTSKVAINLLFTKPIVGDASLQATVADLTSQAKTDGSKLRIVQSNSTVWWFIFPPISFVVHPVTSNVAADVVP